MCRVYNACWVPVCRRLFTLLRLLLALPAARTHRRGVDQAASLTADVRHHAHRGGGLRAKARRHRDTVRASLGGARMRRFSGLALLVLLTAGCESNFDRTVRLLEHPEQDVVVGVRCTTSGGPDVLSNLLERHPHGTRDTRRILGTGRTSVSQVASRASGSRPRVGIPTGRRTHRRRGGGIAAAKVAEACAKDPRACAGDGAAVDAADLLSWK